MQIMCWIRSQPGSSLFSAETETEHLREALGMEPWAAAGSPWAWFHWALSLTSENLLQISRHVLRDQNNMAFLTNRFSSQTLLILQVNNLWKHQEFCFHPVYWFNCSSGKSKINPGYWKHIAIEICILVLCDCYFLIQLLKSYLTSLVYSITGPKGPEITKFSHNSEI